MPNNTALPNIDVLSITLQNTIATKTISLKKIYLELNLYESLLDNFLKGEILLLDTFDLQVNFPLVGNETLQIKLNDQSQSVSKSLSFKIYKYEDNNLYRGITNKKIIKLYFVSQEAITNEQIKVSRKLSGTAESILTSLISDNLASSKTFNSEASDAVSLDIYANFWRPSKIIELVSKKSTTASYSDYVFYEDFDGFHFKTLSNLMAQSEKQELEYSLIAKSTTKTHNIKMFKWNSGFDVIANTRLGLLGTTFYVPHETNYSYTKTSDTFKDKFSDIVGLGKHLIYDESLSDENGLIGVTHLDPDITSSRNVSLKTLENYKVNIKVNGDLDRRVGDVLKIRFPVFDSASYENNNFNGKFLIMKIKHIIKNNGQYEQNILLGKNAFYTNELMSDVTTLNNI
jgi:hypothetical protein